MDEQYIVGWELDKNGKKKLPVVFNLTDLLEGAIIGGIEPLLYDTGNFHCRNCGTRMSEANKGWDYRCYDCYEEDEEDAEWEDEE